MEVLCNFPGVFAISSSVFHRPLQMVLSSTLSNYWDHFTTIFPACSPFFSKTSSPVPCSPQRSALCAQWHSHQGLSVNIAAHFKLVCLPTSSTPVPCLPLNTPNFSFGVASCCPPTYSSSGASRRLTLKSSIHDLHLLWSLSCLQHTPQVWSPDSTLPSFDLFRVLIHSSTMWRTPRAWLFCRSHGVGKMSSSIEENKGCSLCVPTHSIRDGSLRTAHVSKQLPFYAQIPGWSWMSHRGDKISLGPRMRSKQANFLISLWHHQSLLDWIHSFSDCTLWDSKSSLGYRPAGFCWNLWSSRTSCHNWPSDVPATTISSKLRIFTMPG